MNVKRFYNIKFQKVLNIKLHARQLITKKQEMREVQQGATVQYYQVNPE
jgi:hypothetical protein